MKPSLATPVIAAAFAALAATPALGAVTGAVGLVDAGSWRLAAAGPS